jgi:hypothetical protein
MRRHNMASVHAGYHCWMRRHNMASVHISIPALLFLCEHSFQVQEAVF